MNRNISRLACVLLGAFGCLAAGVAPSSAQTLQADVTGYQIIGNTLLSSDTLLEVVEGRSGKLGFADIQKTAQALQARYREAGYGAVVVQVPDQTLSGGLVRLEVVEGKLSQVQVAGNQQFSRNNILASLPALQLKATPSLFSLDRELLMVNENPAKAVRVVFQPGEKRGEVEALAIVDEQPIERVNLSFDNSGTDATGKYRLSLGYQHANVADRDIVFNARAVTSPTDTSQVGVLTTNLRVPLYAQRTFLEFSALTSSTRNTPSQTAAGELRFSGEGNSVGVRGIWLVPTLGEYKHQLSAGVESRRYTNSCSLGSFGSAGCGAAAASVDVLPFALGYAVQKQGALNASLQWVHNLPWYPEAADDTRFNAARKGARSDYSFVRINVAGTAALSSAWSLVGRLEGQSSDQPLVVAEQFGAGGANSVRGYPERVLSGDSGAVASLELRAPWGFWREAKEDGPELQLGFFADGGSVSYQGGGSCATGKTQCDIWSTGVGAFWRVTPQTVVRADVARAGVEAGDTRAGDWTLHVNLNHNF